MTNDNNNNNNDTITTWECTDETWTWQYFPINTSLTAISGFICCLTFKTKILQSTLKYLIHAVQCFISTWVKLLIWTYMLSKHIISAKLFVTQLFGQSTTLRSSSPGCKSWWIPPQLTLRPGNPSWNPCAWYWFRLWHSCWIDIDIYFYTELKV